MRVRTVVLLATFACLCSSTSGQAQAPKATPPAKKPAAERDPLPVGPREWSAGVSSGTSDFGARDERYGKLIQRAQFRDRARPSRSQ